MKALPKTKHAAKIAMARLQGLYEASCRARGNVQIGMSLTGCTDTAFEEMRAHEAFAQGLYDQMVDLRDASRALGWYVMSNAIRYQENNPSVHANRD
jgi:hypothetical protein